MEAPRLMGLLFSLQLLAAIGMTVTAKRRRQIWWSALVVFMLATTLFFTLSCWGTSDITKLNHFMDPVVAQESSLRELLPAEPFWWLLAPFVVGLPYRMALVHGLVVALYALLGVGLARAWRVRAWGGWFALLIITSPMLRGFLQNAHTRQALAALLAVPLFLTSAGVLRRRGVAMMASAGVALTVHLSAVPTLGLAVLPLAVPPATEIRGLPRQRPCRQTSWSSVLWVGPVIVATLVLATVLFPPMFSKVLAYAQHHSFYSSYPVKPVVLRGELALLVGVLVTCLRKGIGLGQFVRCRWSQLLSLFVALYALIQLSIVWRILPQITFRFADVVGLFLLLIALKWFRHYQSLWLLLPLLLNGLLVWGKQVWAPSGLDCGADDDFLCIPDRLPWLIRYD
jgi:hypothetical protein